MKKIIRFFRKKITLINPQVSNRIMYRKIMKKRLNLKNPKTFNEKINYLKLNVFPNDNLIIQCSDKFKVREYLKQKKLEKYLVDIIGVWDNAKDIDFNTLPERFVLKCNHGCGYNVICKNKKELDIKKTIKKLNTWMNEDFSNVCVEKHYSKINRKIICEEFLENDIKDYKFFCFSGNPKFFYISQNIKGDFHDMSADFFYINGNKTPFERKDHKHFEVLPKMPDNLDEMVDLAKKLSEDFKFVRVDLFNVNNKIYFSELTFTPCAGFMPLFPNEYDNKIGDLINIKD